MKKLCVIVAASALVGSVWPVRAEVINGIMAIVNDAVITLDDVELLNAQTSQMLQRQFRVTDLVLGVIRPVKIFAPVLDPSDRTSHLAR